MRKSRVEKEITHQKIVDVAAKRFRERGLEGIGLADIMKEAGLQFGGFYKHFPSREDLVLEAMAVAFHDLDQLEANAGDLPELFDNYVSEHHRDAPATGCALTALAGDVRHASDEVRNLFTRRVKQTLDHYTSELRSTPADKRREKAILLFSAALGAITLARAVSDKSLSREIVSSSRNQLQGLAGGVVEHDGKKIPRRLSRSTGRK